MSLTFVRALLAAVAVTLALTACDGGGGSADNTSADGSSIAAGDSAGADSGTTSGDTAGTDTGASAGDSTGTTDTGTTDTGTSDPGAGTSDPGTGTTDPGTGTTDTGTTDSGTTDTGTTDTGTTDTGTGTTDPGTTTPTPPVVEGSALKGVVTNAVVTAYAPDGKGGYTLLASTTTNDRGAYSLTLPLDFSGAFKLVVSASGDSANPSYMRCDAPSGCGAEPAGATSAQDVNGNGYADYGDWLQLPATFSISAVSWVSGNGFRIVNITPLSNMAAVWAEKFPQGLTPDTADTANERVAAMFALSTADFETYLDDMTDALWSSLANPDQLEITLLCATIEELATKYGVDFQSAIDMLANKFADQNGALLQDSASPSDVPLSLLLDTAVEIAGVVDMPPESLATVQDAMTALRSTLVVNQYTWTSDVALSDILDPLGALGTDINTLLTLTGLDNPTAFVTAQGPYFGWLLAQDNIDMVPVAFQTVLYGLIGSVKLDQVAADSGPVQLQGGDLVVTLDPAAKTVTLVGLSNNQTVNLTIAITGFQAGAATGQFDFGLNGTVTNATAAGDIDGVLSVYTGSTDLSPLVTAVNELLVADPNAAVDFKTALETLAYSATADVTLNGTAHLVRNSDTSQVLGGQVALTASVNLGAAAGQTIATLTVSSADLVLPNGDHLYGLANVPVLTATLADDATVTVDGAATVLGLPEATAHGEATLTAAGQLFRDLRDNVVQLIDSGTTDLTTIVTTLTSVDTSKLALHGTGEIDIPSLASAAGGGMQFRAAIDDLKVTVYQPHSDTVAMTATADPANGAIHLMLGAEPWDIRYLSTPTPRVALVSGDGKYAEITQEDIALLLQSTSLGDVVSWLETRLLNPG